MHDTNITCSNKKDIQENKNLNTIIAQMGYLLETAVHDILAIYIYLHIDLYM